MSVCLRRDDQPIAVRYFSAFSESDCFEDLQYVVYYLTVIRAIILILRL